MLRSSGRRAYFAKLEYQWSAGGWSFGAVQKCGDTERKILRKPGGIMGLRACFISFAVFLLSACAPVALEHGIGGTLIATPSPSYNCRYFTEYDSLIQCQTSTQANCSSEFQTFPTGGIGLCYKPVAGYQVCALAVPNWDWIYSTYSGWCDTGTMDLGVEVFRQDRSLIGCSSAICNCSATPQLSQTCKIGAIIGIACPFTALTAPAACP